MKTVRRFNTYILLLATIGFPLFAPLDIIAFPEIKFKLLSLRLAVALVCFILLILSSRIKDKYIPFMLQFSTYLICLGASFLVYLTGEGFSSPYNAAMFQILAVITVLFHLKTRNFIILLVIVLIQHFIFLFLAGSPTLKELVIALFALGGLTLTCILVHYFFYKYQKENITLRSLLPICAGCKKIMDDKGCWNQIEKYITEHSGTEFTHGFCPDCAKKYEKEIEQIVV